MMNSSFAVCRMESCNIPGAVYFREKSVRKVKRNFSHNCSIRDNTTTIYRNPACLTHDNVLFHCDKTASRLSRNQSCNIRKGTGGSPDVPPSLLF